MSPDEQQPTPVDRPSAPDRPTPAGRPGLNDRPGDLDRAGLAERVAQGAERFRELPTHPDPEDLLTGADVTPAPDPDGGRNPDRDWLLRYGAG
jgi:hypothetical protein